MVDTACIYGLDLWQAWERGEKHGRDGQILRDIEEVLRERGWKLDETWRRQIDGPEPYVDLAALLRRAVSAASFEEWLATANELVERGRS